MDIKFVTLNKYLQGQTPSLDALLKMADYFAVSMDYLTERCSEEEARLIQQDYATKFMQLRRAPYEAYLIGRKTSSTKPTAVEAENEAPWPYNLLDAILVIKKTDWIVTETDMKHIDLVLDTLPERRKEYILMYFRDNMTFLEMAEHEHLSPDRCRQIIHHGLRILRHPSRYNVLFKEYHTMEDIRAKAKQLAEREKQLDEREEKLKTFIASNNLAVKALTMDDSITVLDLTIRTYNCLIRSGISTIGDLINIYNKNPEWLKDIKNLGKVSYQEIIDKLTPYIRDNIETPS